MTLDAMDWVWQHSRSRGNPRMVLLAVADKAPDLDVTTRMGMTELRARLNASRSVVQAAVDKALASGELVEVEAAVGSRASLYQLPHAIGYVRQTRAARGPKSGPVARDGGPGIEAPTDEQGPGIRAGSETGRGPESGPGGTGFRASMGPESGPLNQTTLTKSASKQPLDDLGPSIPDFARPLVDAITTALRDTNLPPLRWNLTSAEWFVVEALITRTGAPTLAEHALAACRRRQVSYARYFLPGWRELAPLPAPNTAGPGASVIPLRSAPRSKVAAAADMYAAALAEMEAQ